MQFVVRGSASDSEITALHCSAFGGGPTEDIPWNARLRRHSLVWVIARSPSGELLGFVNVIGDGGVHAVLLDAIVRPDSQGKGIGRRLVAEAADESSRLGCHWLHADYEPDKAPFYEKACGMVPTRAGLIRLA